MHTARDSQQGGQRKSIGDAQTAAARYQGRTRVSLDECCAGRLERDEAPGESEHGGFPKLDTNICPPFHQPSTGRSRPRMWWCPTGPFAFLPIHAAGIYTNNKSGECCSDYVVSSYTPTLAALLNARRGLRPWVRKEATILLAAVPRPYRGSSLPGTVDEIRAVKESIPQDLLIQLPTEDDCNLATSAGVTVRTMIERLPGASILHLACHGSQNPDNPLESGFIMRDGMLTIENVMPLPLSNALLAFLSACETAKGDQNQPDQTVHLAATMLFTGFKSVIATMWCAPPSFQRPERSLSRL